jgi:membrane associated rhomboid family serine protease
MRRTPSSFRRGRISSRDENKSYRTNPTYRSYSACLFHNVQWTAVRSSPSFTEVTMYDRIPHFYPSSAAPTRRPVAWVNWFIVGSTVAVFLLQLLFLHLAGDDVIGDALAFSPGAWAGHRYWTVLTYAWAHAVAMFGDSSLFWLHIVSNMIPLICLGPALEEILGHWRYLGLYLGGAVVSAVVWYVSVILSGTSDPDDGIIGASGAVFAVIAAIGTAMPGRRVTVLLFYILPLRMSMRVLALVVCGLEAAQALFHWMPEIAHSAHLGGAAFGFLYTLALRRRLPREEFP